MALFPQQQLWHLHRFVSVQPVDIHKFRICHTSRLKQALLQLSICISVWMTLNRIMLGNSRLSVRTTITGTKGEQHVTVFIARVFHNHPLRTVPCCTFRTITPSIALYLRDNTAEKRVAPFDGNVYFLKETSQGTFCMILRLKFSDVITIQLSFFANFFSFCTRRSLRIQ